MLRNSLSRIFLVFCAFALVSCDFHWPMHQSPVRDGMITLMVTGSAVDVDFSQLDTGSVYDQFSPERISAPDITLTGFPSLEMHAPYGMLDMGAVFNVATLQTYFNNEAEYRACSYGTGIPLDCIASYREYMEDYLLPVPALGFVTGIEISYADLEPRLYYIRTQEGAFVALLQFGFYVGGIDRRHFYWRYVD